MQVIALDIRTLSFIATSIAVIYAVGLFAFGLSQRTFRGFTMLTLASCSFGVGLFLLGFRGVLPDLVTVVVANSLLVVALVLYLEGVRRFHGITVSVHPIGILAIFLNLGLFLYYTYEVPSVNHRIIAISVIAAIVGALTTREFFRTRPAYWRVPGAVTGVIFGGYSIFQAYRIVWTLGESSIQSFMSAGTVHALAFIFIIILIVGSGFGILWMANARFEFELAELANHDQLTSVLNRRGAMTLADQEFSKMSRIDMDLAILMIDIDHFKDVNDRLGHNGGDKVLTAFAALINGNLRPYDILGRVGGEEFIVILPNTALDQAVILAERLRQAVETSAIEVEGEEVLMTASFGVAAYLPGIDTMDRLISCADKALYAAKRQGRNRVVAFDECDHEQRGDLTLSPDTGLVPGRKSG